MPHHALVEIPDAPDGVTELKLRDAQGVRIGFFQGASEDVDEQLITDLLAWARRHSHGPAVGLSIIPRSASLVL